MAVWTTNLKIEKIYYIKTNEKKDIEKVKK